MCLLINHETAQASLHLHFGYYTRDFIKQIYLVYIKFKPESAVKHRTKFNTDMIIVTFLSNVDFAD